MLMINCRKISELGTAYLEGELSWWQTFSFYVHWMLCPPCRNFEDQLRKTKETTEAVGQCCEAPPPKELSEALLAALKKKQTPPQDP